MIRYSVVIPTIGRPCLRDCLAALDAATGPAPEQVVVVDDRPVRAGPPVLPLQVVTSGGIGPAAARNVGWQVTGTPWVAFLDDDVRVSGDWRSRIAADLADAPPSVAGVQGRITVPVPDSRRPTDWERNTLGLAGASWITADMAYRRVALAEAGGFDERFPRAFREDADLALRLRADGWQRHRGKRRTVHPVRSASPWASLRSQAGNADDALMRALHGAGWHERAEAPRGRPSHVLITGALLAAAGLAAARRPQAARVAAAAVRAVQRHGLATAMITNQSGIARGLLSQADAEAVNARVVPTPQTSVADLTGVRVAGDLAEAVRMITGEIPLAPIWPNGPGD